MKNLIILFLLGSALLTIGCGEKCDDINCGINGTCIDGVCNCNEGYSGATCEIHVCDNINCNDNGTCVDGSCNCDPGYSGVNCEINVCDNVDCGQNGVCDLITGMCNCELGYEGEFCETEEREKFMGTWNSNAWICDSDINMAELTLRQGPSINEIRVSNLGIIGIVDGAKVDFPLQVINVFGEMREYSGFGEIIDNQLTLSLTDKDLANGQNRFCSGTFTM